MANGEQFAVQLIGALAIMGWTVVTSAITFLTIKHTIGMRVDKLGNSSVRYGLALFGESGDAKALGFVVHVFVDRESGRPVSIPAPLREALAAIQSSGK